MTGNRTRDSDPTSSDRRPSRESHRDRADPGELGRAKSRSPSAFSDTFAFNTDGVMVTATSRSPLLGQLANRGSRVDQGPTLVLRLKLHRPESPAGGSPGLGTTDRPAFSRRLRMIGQSRSRLCGSIVCEHSIVSRSNRPMTRTFPGARPRALRTALTLPARTKNRSTRGPHTAGLSRLVGSKVANGPGSTSRREPFR